MNGAMAAEAQTDEIGASIVALIFVYVMKVHGHVLVALTARRARASVVLPRFESAISVAFADQLSFVMSIGNAFVRCASSLQAAAIAFIAFDRQSAVVFAKIARQRAARFAAFCAQSFAETIFSPLFHALFVSLKAFGAKLLSGRQRGNAASHANLHIGAGNGANAVLVNAHAACDLSGIAGLFEKLKSAFAVDHDRSMPVIFGIVNMHVATVAVSRSMEGSH